MDPAYELKEFGAERIDEMVKVWQDSGLPYRPKGRDRRSELERQMAENPDMFVGAFLGEELVGVVVGTYDVRKGYINRLAVDPGHRRKGIGLALVNEIDRRLREKGFGIVCTLIEGENPASYALFEKAGYNLHEEIKYLRKRDNKDI
jgi:ribosomal protein S18 acetylase RimI-like enzyme